MIKDFYKITAVIIFVIISVAVSPAQNEVKKGIELFNTGNNKEAITLFEKLSKTDSKNPEVWNYLGLSYLNIDDVKNGRKAFEKAVKLNNLSSSYLTNLAYANLLSRKPNKTQDLCHKALEIEPKNANAYYIRGTSFLWEGQFEKSLADAEKAIEFRPNFLQSYVLKADTLLYEFGEGWAKAFKKSDTRGYAKDNLNSIEQAIVVLETCEKVCDKNDQLEFLRLRKSALSAFRDYFNNTANPSDASIDAPDDPTLKAIKILEKPRPGYTDSARNAWVQGEIFLSVLFHADGSVKHIFILKGLGNGLDQQAIAAAARIRFEPAQRNGKPFSVVKIVQYNFTIY